MSVFSREILYASRALRKSRAFSSAAVVTLALGLGSTTAIFSIVESVLLRPLPFPEPERIVVPESRNRTTGDRWSITYADFMDWRDNHTFEYVAPYQDTEMDLTGGDEAVRVKAAAVGQQLADGLAAVRHPLLAGVRGRGLWLAAVLTQPLAAQAEVAARDAGFLVNAVQPDAIRLAPALILRHDQAAAFLDAWPAILDALSHPGGPVPDGPVPAREGA